MANPSTATDDATELCLQQIQYQAWKISHHTHELSESCIADALINQLLCVIELWATSASINRIVRVTSLAFCLGLGIDWEFVLPVIDTRRPRMFGFQCYNGSTDGFLCSDISQRSAWIHCWFYPHQITSGTCPFSHWPCQFIWVLCPWIKRQCRTLCTFGRPCVRHDLF